MTPPPVHYLTRHLTIACAAEQADYEGEPTQAENEAQLVRRLVSDQCDKYHTDTSDAGCGNPSCQCWCHE